MRRKSFCLAEGRPVFVWRGGGNVCIRNAAAGGTVSESAVLSASWHSASKRYEMCVSFFFLDAKAAVAFKAVEGLVEVKRVQGVSGLLCVGLQSCRKHHTLRGEGSQAC